MGSPPAQTTQGERVGRDVCSMFTPSQHDDESFPRTTQLNQRWNISQENTAKRWRIRRIHQHQLVVLNEMPRKLRWVPRKTTSTDVLLYCTQATARGRHLYGTYQSSPKHVLAAYLNVRTASDKRNRVETKQESDFSQQLLHCANEMQWMNAMNAETRSRSAQHNTVVHRDQNETNLTTRDPIERHKHETRRATNLHAVTYATSCQHKN